jgi:hypothetical protein
VRPWGKLPLIFLTELRMKRPGGWTYGRIRPAWAMLNSGEIPTVCEELEKECIRRRALNYYW